MVATAAGAIRRVQFDESTLNEMEQVVAECQLAQTDSNAGKFAKAFALAAGIRELRKRITDAMMGDITSLQGTSLGFRTDKDRDGGYPVPVVKECLIEATLRGANPVGNEFNIISGKCYLTKEFFQRAVGMLPGITDVKPQPGVPVMRDGGALVPYKITWKRDAQLQSIERTIPVRVNQQMGADAIIGKATRKIFKAAYEQITGSTSIPDGEVDDTMIDGQAVSAAAAKAAELNQKFNGNGGAKPSPKDSPTRPEPPSDAQPTASESIPADHPSREAAGASGDESQIGGADAAPDVEPPPADDGTVPATYAALELALIALAEQWGIPDGAGKVRSTLGTAFVRSGVKTKAKVTADWCRQQWDTAQQGRGIWSLIFPDPDKGDPAPAAT